MTRRFIPFLAALAIVPVLASHAAELPGGGLQQEYFVRQQADEAVLIRVDGHEAEFESAVFTIDGERIIASGVPASRIAPLFQYVPGAPDDRQLDIRITAPLVTGNSRFDMGLSRMNVRDDRSARLDEAYRWLSFGLELPPADTAANWSIKVNALLGAANGFRGFGMEELELWSRFFVAQLTLHRLGDNHSALQAAEDLLASPGARRQPVIRLATTRLKAEALSALRGAGELPVTADDSADPVQVAAAATRAQAIRLGQDFEHAEALFLSGRDFAARQRYADALQRYQDALGLAVDIEADDLATRIREDLVDIHGKQGDVAATSEVLQAIESQLTEDGANDELAQNLLAQGRILVRTYRFDAATEVLRQALEFEHNSATRDQVRLALAEAAWGLGDLDEAWAQARAAVVDPAGNGWRRATPVLDTGRGLAILAGVARVRGDHRVMSEARAAQRRTLDSAAERVLWAWERAQDELDSRPPGQSAAPWLRQVRDGASAAGLSSHGHLAQLWLCLLGVDCLAGAVDAAFRSLRDAAIPRHRVAARYLAGMLHMRDGRHAAAADTLESGVRELVFLRYSVPGVMGDWSWRYSERLGEALLDALRATGDDARLLLGLARLRWLRAANDPVGLPFDPAVSGLDTDSFRAQLARRQWPGLQDDVAALDHALAPLLTEGQGAFESAADFLSRPGLTRWLNALEAGEAVLDYDFSGRTALALVGTRAGVVRVSLGNRSGVDGWRTFLEQAGEHDVTALDRLSARWGQRLLAPLRDRLPKRVYLAAGAPMGYLPFEAMAGSTTGQRPQFIRLAAFPARPAPAVRLDVSVSSQVFLAGQPSDYSSGYLERLDTGAELRAVMDRFVGPGLQVIQGAALQADEFDTPAFRQASLAHLAMPAWLDTDRQNRSWLELSEARRTEGRVRLRPRDLARWRMQAGLVVFSRAEAAATGRAVRPPLVSQALAAGAGAVLVTTWSLEGDGQDAASAAFLGSFYAAWQAGAPPPAALERTRDATREAGGTDWARYQIWVE